MRRRHFITLLGTATATGSLAARAQLPSKLPTIGFFSPNTESAQTEWTDAFVQRLRELGWTDGRTVAIEYRWAEGHNERLAEIAADLVRKKVDVIVPAGTPAIAAAKQATSVIPIVFAADGDPVGTGLVASLAHPGGNVTGMSMENTDTGTKRLELLRKTVPNVHRLAVLANVGFPDAVLDLRQVEAVAGKLAMEPVALEIRRAQDIAPLFADLGGRADALYVCGDPLVTTNRISIATLALGARLPTVYNFREHVDVGGLMSYGADLTDLHRRAAELVDKVLRGAKPADIPVQQPIKFDLAINLKTAKALGLAVPATLIAIADEVIE